VKRPAKRLPFEQQLIAAGRMGCTATSASTIGKLYRLFAVFLGGLLDLLLWCIHGCPRRHADPQKFTAGILEKNCNQAGWPFLLADDFSSRPAADFIARQMPQLIILLGELPIHPQVVALARAGCLRARRRLVARTGSELVIEHIRSSSADTAATLARVSIPWQPYDGPAGHTLKADLIADDLLLKATYGLTSTSRPAAHAIGDWIEKTLLPSLQPADSGPRNVISGRFPFRPYRRVWKLCLDTLLLGSPFLIGRNWYRRLRARYPVLILTHHVVSDRPHRLGISTETFWRQARFLTRHYRIVSLSTAVDLLHSGDLSVPTAALTFDDGYADNFLGLRAVAEEMQLPVTHFIVTEPVENREEFVHDVAHGERGALPMTWDQIRYWSSRGAEFGSHTRTHFDCASRDRATLRREIAESRKDIESHIGKRVRFFAFPFGGRENISSEAVEIASGAYEHFASGFGGDNLRHADACNQHLFRRNLYPHPWELELELQSVFDWAERIKRILHLGILNPTNASHANLPALSATMSANSDRESRLMLSN